MALMKVPRSFSPDVLQGLGGIEQALRRRRNLGVVASVGLVVIIGLQTGLAIVSATTNVPWGGILDQWYLILPSLVLGVVLALFVASRYWIRESRAPFRYTCRVVDLTAVPPTSTNVLPLLRHDLAELLNERIGRLSFLNDEPEDAEQFESHVHIAGEYLVRKVEDRPVTVEVTARVRVGGPAAAESLAHPVRYEIPEGTDPDRLGRDHYERIVERVYFSIATRLYKQIREDVERKIALLPTRYLRATAYLFEAKDYAQSNTLDAYDDAQELFERARLLYHPASRGLPRGPVRRLAARALRVVRWLLRAFRKVLSHVVVRLGKRDFMLAETELSLANTLVARRALARLSGRRVNQIFIARTIASRARDRVERLARIGYRGAEEALFDAQVTLALVLHYLGADERAEQELTRARAAMPDRAEQHANYLFTAALLEPRTTFALSLLRRAIEISPRFEVAQFERARRTDMLWQFRPGLEPTVAKSVIEEYTNVVRTNPGNIQAWSSLGHARWLLATDDAGLKHAEDEYRRGLAYKEIKRETSVAGLHYSLARVTAERGDFAEAYRHYVASTTASVGEGIAHGSWAEHHNSVVRSPAVLERFVRYVGNVESHRPNTNVEARIVRSVTAFVRNDYGEACLNFFERTGKAEYLERARTQFEEARTVNPTYVIPSYNLCVLNILTGDYAAAEKHIRMARSREPKWPEAILAHMFVEARNSQRPVSRRDRLEREIEEMEATLDQLKDHAKRLRKTKLSGEFEEATRARLSPRDSGLGADAFDILRAGSAPFEVEDEIERFEGELRRLSSELERVERELDECARTVRDAVHGLVPHAWLWEDSDEGAQFRWSALKDSPGSGERWERDFGDLNVRALEMWAHTRALSRVDDAERRRIPWARNRTRDLCLHLERHFWPERADVLVALLQLREDSADSDDIEDRLGRLAARLLAFDPANYRLLLDLERVLPAVSGGLAQTKHHAFLEALRQRDVAPPVLVWLGERFEELGEYDSACKAYGQALDAEQGAIQADRPAILLGKARAEWGIEAFDSSVATLAEVSKSDVEDGWRTRFVRTLVSRRKLGGPPVPAEGDAPGADGYPTLASWLRQEQARCLAEGSGVADAGEALVLVARARYEKAAPNRTTPPPDVSGTTGDPEIAGAAFVVPLIRRVAVEANPHVFDTQGVDRFRQLVREVPEVRKKIEADTGVPVPPVAVAKNYFIQSDGYRVLVNEIPVATGQIGKDQDFTPLLDDLDRVVRDKLGSVLGVDDIVGVLKEMDSAASTSVKDALSDDERKLRALRAVRRLLCAGAHVDFSEVLGELAQQGDENDFNAALTEILHRSVAGTGERPAAERGRARRGSWWVTHR